MLQIVILVVASAVVVIGGVALLMFLDVAFAASPQHRTLTEGGGWRLPLLGGEELRRWAKGMAERVVSKHAGRARDKQAVLGIASEVLDGTSQVIGEVASPIHRPRSHATSCSSRCHEMIGVTAPEALAMADELQRTQAKWAVETICEQARVNAQRAATLNHEQFSSARLTCPLYTAGGRCATFGSRPLYCRGACPECAGGECQRASLEMPESQAFATTIGQGVLSGLTTGLESAGLDGHVYELNSALSVALNTPDAAARFARGEPVFNGCHLYS